MQWIPNNDDINFSQKNRIMVSSADIAILTKVVEIAKRFGLRASEADAYIKTNIDASYPQKVFSLDFGGVPSSPEIHTKWDKMRASLGIEEGNSVLFAADLSELEDAVDRSLSLAPRSRSI